MLDEFVNLVSKLGFELEHMVLRLGALVIGGPGAACT
jgi:hypothetical protein